MNQIRSDIMGDGLSIDLSLEDGTPFAYLTVFEDGKGGYTFDLHDLDDSLETDDSHKVSSDGSLWLSCPCSLSRRASERQSRSTLSCPSPLCF